KGLAAHVMDFLHLDFPDASFDAVFALNCLLHVPKADLPAVLAEIRRLLRPGGLFYMGVYGGNNFEGIRTNDDHEPKRFFALYTHEGMQAVVSAQFGIVSFDVIPMQKNADGSPANYHFQSMILRRPA
ncbi:MAG: class I SAM-dependent methyltransferase, partial [Caldilineaceae bacterium]|nr:class I SAM-dependent methyltransferase [Caldilineaceae bacterium]